MKDVIEMIKTFFPASVCRYRFAVDRLHSRIYWIFSERMMFMFTNDVFQPPIGYECSEFCYFFFESCPGKREEFIFLFCYDFMWCVHIFAERAIAMNVLIFICVAVGFVWYQTDFHRQCVARFSRKTNFYRCSK